MVLRLVLVQLIVIPRTLEMEISTNSPMFILSFTFMSCCVYTQKHTDRDTEINMIKMKILKYFKK